MPRDRFINPANGAAYDWQTNHSEEEESEKLRQIRATATTGGTTRVWTQGEESPYTIRWTGSILHRAQFVEMWRWFERSRTQTIFLRDFDGQEYECQITSFAPRRQRKLALTGRDASMPYHYWTYSITFQVYAFRAGDMKDAGVTA